MRAARKFGWRYVLLMSMVFAPWLMAAQCWSKVQNTAIPVEISKDFDFDVDIDQYTQGKFQNVQGGKLPDQAPPVEIPIDVKQEVDISNDPNIQKYGTKVAGIDINKMEIQVVSNTANINVPRVNILMGDKGQKPTTVVGYLSGIPAGQKPTENVIKDDAGRNAISSYLTKFKFAFGAGTKLTVKGGDSVPKGKIKLKIKMTVVFRITPLK